MNRQTSLHRAQILGLSLLLDTAVRLVAQDAVTNQATSRVVVTGVELPSAYGAPPAFSRTRFSPTTTAYVLPPGATLSASVYEGNFFHHSQPDHTVTQEFEFGLPHRIGLAAEFQAEDFRGVSQIRAVSAEIRYAFADWNKIPLNPTIFAEYKFGTGHVLRDEAVGTHDEGEAEVPEFHSLRKLTSRVHRAKEEGPGADEEGDRPELPDVVEGRVLLAQDFGEHIEWALNGFFEYEVGGDRGREIGFAQSVMMPLVPNEALKVGVEMLYTNFSDKGIRGDAENRFVIGPSLAWKPNWWSRIDVSPLFGINDQSPAAQVFVVFSMVFGGGHGGEAEAPASMRNR